MSGRLGRRLRSFLGGSASVFLGAQTRFFFGATIVIGAAAFFLTGFLSRAALTAARFLERVEARFLGLAKETVLKLAACGRIVYRTRRGCWSRRRLRRASNGRRLLRGLLHLRRFDLSRTAEDATLLYLHDHGVRPPVAEALLHLSGFNRTLQA